eukprot:1004224-Prorocentrum_minimum.AAC.1
MDDVEERSAGNIPLTCRGNIPLTWRGNIPLTWRSNIPLTWRGNIPLTWRGNIPLTGAAGAVSADRPRDHLRADGGVRFGLGRPRAGFPGRPRAGFPGGGEAGGAAGGAASADLRLRDARSLHLSGALKGVHYVYETPARFTSQSFGALQRREAKQSCV